MAKLTALQLTFRKMLVKIIKQLSFLIQKRVKAKIHPVHWGSFRSTRPISQLYGLDRGNPIDRFYIEAFLESHSNKIKGKVLELLNNSYTRLYGKDKVTCSDVLDIDATNKNATIIANLTAADSIPSDTYDCFILTQTLQFIYDLKSALFHSHRILKSGGVLLVTVPSISRIDCVAGVKGDYWRFTSASLSKLLEEFFVKENVQVRSWGNYLSGFAFWAGISQSELRRAELEFHDENFPVIISGYAEK